MELIYRLMTSVPENWIPLVAAEPESHGCHAAPPAGAPPDGRVRRVGTPRLIHPRGTLLLTTPDADPATDRLRLAEEEVKREGVR